MSLRVTEALALAGVTGDMSFVTDHGLARGSAVHKAIELHLLGTLDESTIHPDVAPRLASFRSWQSHHIVSVGALEMEVKGLGYVGHPDFVGLIDGYRYVVDWKNGAPAPWHRLQTALYALAVDPSNRIKRAALYLQADGSCARWCTHVDRTDYSVAQACVAVASWKKIYGGN